MPRLNRPRLPALDPEDWSESASEALVASRRDGRQPINIMKTLAHHGDLAKAWLPFAGHVLGGSTLPVRERELLILRAGWLCQSEYEFGQHTLIAQRAGMSDEEISAITVGPDSPVWSGEDADLLRAADELHDDAFISDTTWERLSGRWSTEQLVDIVFTVGQYQLVSMALNTFGVQLDEGVPSFPARG